VFACCLTEDWEKDIVTSVQQYCGFVDANMLCFLWPTELNAYRVCFVSGPLDRPLISCFQPPLSVTGTQLAKMQCSCCCLYWWVLAAVGLRLYHLARLFGIGYVAFRSLPRSLHALLFLLARINRRAGGAADGDHHPLQRGPLHAAATAAPGPGRAAAEWGLPGTYAAVEL
jgi:hypothetical protein